jgi:hypothetical protein
MRLLSILKSKFSNLNFYLSYIFYDIIISQYVNELVTNTNTRLN